MEKVDALIEELKNSKPAEGFSILIPGEIEKMNSEKNKSGFEIDTVLYNKLKDICDKKEIDLNEYMIK